MNDLRTLITQSKAVNKELVASTVRMPKELHSFIEGLSDQLSISKQDVLLKLIEEGVKIAEEALRLDEYEEVEADGFHVLNTNRRNDDNDHEEMVNKGIAAAFYNPWKLNIDRIKKDDVVFLYENGVGIVAFGKGTGETLKKDKYGDKDECHFQKLKDFRVLVKPLSAAEVKRILGRNVVFLRTMSGIPDGKKILDKVSSMQNI